MNCKRRRDAAAAFRRRLKLRVARQNNLDFDGTLVPFEKTNNNDLKVDEDEWLKQFVNKGSKLAYSNVLLINSTNEEAEIQKQLEKWIIKGNTN